MLTKSPCLGLFQIENKCKGKTMKRCEKCKAEVEDAVEVCECGSTSFVEVDAQVDDANEASKLSILQKWKNKTQSKKELAICWGWVVLGVLAMLYFIFQVKAFGDSVGIVILCWCAVVVAGVICIEAIVRFVLGIIYFKNQQKQSKQTENKEKENV